MKENKTFRGELEVTLSLFKNQKLEEVCKVLEKLVDTSKPYFIDTYSMFGYNKDNPRIEIVGEFYINDIFDLDRGEVLLFSEQDIWHLLKLNVCTKNYY